MSEPAATTQDVKETFDDTAKSSDAYVIDEIFFNPVVLKLLGREVTKQDGATFTKKFFVVEKRYKKDDKWLGTSYFELSDLTLLLVMIPNAIGMYYAKPKAS